MLSTLQSLDITFLDAIRGFFDLSDPIILMMIHIGSDSLLIVAPVILILIWVTSLRESSEAQKSLKSYTLLITLSIFLSVILCLLSNQILPFRPRPESVTAIAPLIDHLPDNSFPSMHATFAGAFLTALFFFFSTHIQRLTLSRRSLRLFLSLPTRIILILMGLFMVFSRILAGIHYPGDILAGLLLG